MSVLFSFFLRLFLCFVGAKFLLQAVGLEGREYLIGLTILLVINVYWLSYLVFRNRRAGDSPPPEAPRPPGPGPKDQPSGPSAGSEA